MAKQKPYTRSIEQNSEDSHQTSPHWIVTFVRFNTRDYYNFGAVPPAKFEPTRNPLIVENDCISVNVSSSKDNPTPSATLVLKQGDLNYATALSPGDFVLVNMVNWTSKAIQIRDRARSGQSINRPEDGFKGIFKINNVNKILTVDPASGQKVYRCQVTAYAFTEFNNSIYYNPTLGNSIDKDTLIYNLNKDLLKVLNSKKNITEVLILLTSIILGNGTGNATNSKVVTSLKKEKYQIPEDVFKLLGISGKYAIDMYRMMIGKWISSKQTLKKESYGMNPGFASAGTVAENGSYQEYKETLDGKIPIKTAPLYNVRLVDLLKSYLNDVINEMYFCFRIDQKTNSVLPKIVIRQKPFNTEHGIRTNKTTPKAPPQFEQIKGTKYLGLPRWRIDPELIFSLNLSKNEGLRFNFVHIVGKTENPALDSALLAFQNASSSTVQFDNEDIKRHGLRPYTRVTNFDWPEEGKADTGYAEKWSKLVWDWIHGGELKLNGNIQTVGIEENICVGDNLQIDRNVFHIEAISHVGGIDPDGRKYFRTNISLSHGIDERSSSRGPVYAEMDHTDAYKERLEDYGKNGQMLPGFSDTQDIPGRKKGEEVKETKQLSFTPNGIKDK